MTTVAVSAAMVIKVEGAFLAKLKTAGIATRTWAVVGFVCPGSVWILMVRASNAVVPTAGAMKKAAATSVKRGGGQQQMQRVYSVNLDADFVPVPTRRAKIVNWAMS